MPNDYKALMQALIDGGVDIDPKSVSEEYLLNAIRSSGIEGLPEPKSRLDAYLGALVKHIKEGGSSGSIPTKLSDLENDLYYSHTSVMSLNSDDHSMTIEDSNGDERATYFEVYHEFNNEELDKLNLRDTDFLLTLKLGNETFTFSKANTEVYDGDPDNDAPDGYDFIYGTWENENWNFEEGASPLYCVEIELGREDGDPNYWLDVYGCVNDSVADNISFTIDILANEGKKIPKECLDVTKLSDLENDLYGCDEYVSLVQITDDQWEDESGPCHYWHMEGKTSFTEVDVQYDFNSIFDLSQMDFLVTMKVGDETVKISTSDFIVDEHSSTNFGGSYGFEPGDIHDESFDIDAALTKPVCQLWLSLYVLNDRMRASIEAHTNNPNTFVTLDFIKKQTKKIPREYLDIPTDKGTPDLVIETVDEFASLSSASVNLVSFKITAGSFSNVKDKLSKNEEPFVVLKGGVRQVKNNITWDSKFYNRSNQIYYDGLGSSDIVFVYFDVITMPNSYPEASLLRICIRGSATTIVSANARDVTK